MQKRILLVDDEPQEIENLQRGLESMAKVWELAFASSGAEALELMAKAPFDAIITDLHMPDMDGGELLNRVGNLYPATVRFILSSFADRELIMACVWGTHQFVAKPCDPEKLILTVRRALTLDAWLSNDKIKALVSQIGKLPSLPSFYFEVLKQLDQPYAAVQGVGEAIVKDMAMTAKLLQMVNSAFFGLPRKITNANEAIAILGMDTVKSLVLSIQAYSNFEKLKMPHLSMDRLWAHSLAVASGAKKIALAETQDENLADETFTAGLLHDIGKLILASKLSEKYKGVVESARERKVPLWQVEQETFGASHAEAGAYMLGLWGMPLSLVEATALHHCPSECFNKMFSPLTAVHVANVLAYEQHPDSSKLVGPQLDLGYLKELGLEDRLAAWRDAVFETSPGHEQPKPRDQKPPSKPEKPVKANPQPVASKSPPPPTPASKFRWLVPVFSSVALLFVIWLFWQRINTLILGVPDEPVPPSKSRPAKSLGVGPMPVQAREPDTNAARQLPHALVPPETNLARTLPPVKPPFPVLKLQGIFYREDKPCVMINGLTHYKGDKISGAEITAIDRETVTLTYQGETRILKVR